MLANSLFTASILAVCGGNGGQSKSYNYPNKPITLIVPFGAGGWTDAGARVLAPFMEKELGVTINIKNEDGGGGWVGWTDLLKAKPDGYTIGCIATPTLMTGYMDPQYKRNESLENFAVIGNHVLDYGVIAVNAKETRFKDVKDFFEYARTHELTATSSGVGSDDHIAILKVNNECGTKFVPVHDPSVSGGKVAIMGGYVDVYFFNVGEATVSNKNGELKVLVVMAPERSHFLPDIPTCKELGYPVTSWCSRGLAAPKGVDKTFLDKLVEAFEKAIKDPEQIEKMEQMGLLVKPLKGTEYMDFLKQEEAGVAEVSDLLGWKK